jgi:PAS domain-containing protein
MREVDGEVCGFYCHAIDVTARIEAERVRDEALRLFEISMANAPIGETLLTTDGRALRINPALCPLIGATAEELAGRSYRDFVHPDDLPVVIDEHRYLRMDGTVIWMQRSAVLAPGGEYGAEDVIIAQMQDVTARGARRGRAPVERGRGGAQLGLPARRRRVHRPGS